MTRITTMVQSLTQSQTAWSVKSSITKDKANGGDQFPAERVQILNEDAVKVLHSICQQIWKTQQWPQDLKMSVFIPVPRRTMPKNVQTTAQLHSFHTLVTATAKSLQLCQTLCNPIDGSPPGSTVPGILQARTLEWVAIPFSNA